MSDFIFFDLKRTSLFRKIPLASFFNEQTAVKNSKIFQYSRISYRRRLSKTKLADGILRKSGVRWRLKKWSCSPIFNLRTHFLWFLIHLKKSETTAVKIRKNWKIEKMKNSKVVQIDSKMVQIDPRTIRSDFDFQSFEKKSICFSIFFC